MNQTQLDTTVADIPPGVDATGMARDVAGLVSPPALHLRLLQLIRDRDSTVGQIGEMIAQDPNLTARVLRMVNSPFYGLAKPVDTVPRAVTVIGMRQLNSLVTAVSVVASFSRIEPALVSMETFWRHSLLTALLARTLAWRCRVLHPERLFVAGLLHDIGSLVLYNRLPELCRELLETAAGDEQALYAAEMQRLGFSHGHLGALLLGMWDLPETLTETVRHHHRPDEANGAAREAGIVHLAEALANGAGNGGFCELPGSAPAPEAAAWERIGLPPERADGRELVAEAGEELAVLTAALTGH